MQTSQYATKSQASLQARLASFPIVSFSYYTLPIEYEEYLTNSDKDLDVVGLLYDVESSVLFARVARSAGHKNHQHIHAERFDKHRYHKGQGCEYIT